MTSRTWLDTGHKVAAPANGHRARRLACANGHRWIRAPNGRHHLRPGSHSKICNSLRSRPNTGLSLKLRLSLCESMFVNFAEKNPGFYIEWLHAVVQDFAQRLLLRELATEWGGREGFNPLLCGRGRSLKRCACEPWETNNALL